VAVPEPPPAVAVHLIPEQFLFVLDAATQVQEGAVQLGLGVFLRRTRARPAGDRCSDANKVRQQKS
jgi:hypothetical protein